MEADEGRVGLEERGEGLVYVIDRHAFTTLQFLAALGSKSSCDAFE